MQCTVVRQCIACQKQNKTDIYVINAGAGYVQILSEPNHNNVPIYSDSRAVCINTEAYWLFSKTS